MGTENDVPEDEARPDQQVPERWPTQTEDQKPMKKRGPYDHRKPLTKTSAAIMDEIVAVHSGALKRLAEK